MGVLVLVGRGVAVFVVVGVSVAAACSWVGAGVAGFASSPPQATATKNETQPTMKSASGIRRESLKGCPFVRVLLTIVRSMVAQRYETGETSGGKAGYRSGQGRVRNP